MHTRLKFAAVFIAALSIGVSLRAAGEAAPAMDPAAALHALKEGNARFVSRPVSAGKPTAERRKETASAQHPFAIIVGCSDSRTPPELIFDQNLGDLFVVRTAGNVVDDFELGTIEYAVGHLGVRLIVVMGHAGCGAVAAAVASGSAPGHIGAIVKEIEPAVDAARGEPGDLLTNAIKENVARTAAKIRRDADFGSAGSSVRIVKGVYDLSSGKVEWLPD
jgi:carbonic anhydrase